MSRFVRRCCLLGALALVAVPITASVAGGQELPTSPITLTVHKVVSGPATTGSSVTLSCATESVVFNFDGTGVPTTADAGGASVSIVDGAWQLTGSADDSPLACTFEETAAGGAASTAWTCTYSNEPLEASAAQEEDLGCAAASGDGTGPVGLTLGSVFQVGSQTADVTFTNTYIPLTPLQPAQPAAAVVTQPAFTG